MLLLLSLSSQVSSPFCVHAFQSFHSLGWCFPFVSFILFTVSSLYALSLYLSSTPVLSPCFLFLLLAVLLSSAFFIWGESIWISCTLSELYWWQQFNKVQSRQCSFFKAMNKHLSLRNWSSFNSHCQQTVVIYSTTLTHLPLFLFCSTNRLHGYVSVAKIYLYD